jgi:hypothetical protein
MNITEALTYKVSPPDYVLSFLRRIRYAIPCEGITREGVCPVGSFLIPFVDRLGGVMLWIPFFNPEDHQGMTFVKLPYPNDPSRVYRVNKDGSLEVVWRQVNEDN